MYLIRFQYNVQHIEQNLFEIQLYPATVSEAMQSSVTCWADSMSTPLVSILQKIGCVLERKRSLFLPFLSEIVSKTAWSNDYFHNVVSLKQKTE